MCDLWWCRCEGLISSQRCLQVDNISLLLCQLPVSLRQHGVHLLASLPLGLRLLSLEEINKPFQTFYLVALTEEEKSYFVVKEGRDDTPPCSPVPPPAV